MLHIHLEQESAMMGRWIDKGWFTSTNKVNVSCCVKDERNKNQRQEKEGGRLIDIMENVS